MSVLWHPAGSQRRLRDVVAARVRDRVDAAALGEVSPAERRLKVREEALAVLRDHRVVLGAGELTKLVNEVSDEVVGFGPIEALLKDPEVTEVISTKCPHSGYPGGTRPGEVGRDDEGRDLRSDLE